MVWMSERDRRAGLKGIRLAAVMAAAWDAAEGRATIWMILAGGLTLGLLFTTPLAGTLCMLGYAVMAFLTARGQTQTRDAIEDGLRESGHDHD